MCRRRFTICITHYSKLGSQICDNEMGGALGTRGEYRGFHRVFWWKIGEDYLEDLERDADDILKCIFTKLDGVVWTGLF